MNLLLRAAGALLIPACALIAAPVHAQPQPQETFRIGFVNPDRVLREAQPAKAAQAKLEAEFLKREKDLTAQGDALKAASEKFDREAPTLSDSQRAARQRTLIDQDRDFQRRRREFQEDLNARKNEELQQVYERANRVVKQVAEAEKYDAILQEAIYINPKHDITDKVIKALNASSATPPSSSPASGK
ncbi:OmpH family outer membrane protein [Variovorax sp. PBL-E5]|uniref:OmpH family outer membrane protein n=1 Tax=Variovorax sp. PBL-E5 TaxID=434014 RepID=UPI0013182A4F|nr:OmpH family outer membrane protein [Variovorax sp. PBL-E5]VTU27770.1 periplasmic chaperone [Variovorax sp. PBL-E5]